jgi:hypothetical protein
VAVQLVKVKTYNTPYKRQRERRDEANCFPVRIKKNLPVDGVSE